MRIWHKSIALAGLCRPHLLGLHREIHGVLTFASPTGKGGSYRRHPETLRWVGHVPALRRHHDKVEREMLRRGYCPKSPAPYASVKGSASWPHEIASLKEQIDIIKRKRCGCKLTANNDNK